MMKRFLLATILLAWTLATVVLVRGEATGVVAEAIGTANLRSLPSVDGQLVGEISIGTQYPVIGQSELYPWVLLGEVADATPKGWVYRDLVTIYGNLVIVPFTEQEVVVGQAAAPPQTAAPVNPAAPTATLVEGVQVTPPEADSAPTTIAPTPTPTFVSSVVATAQGEINVRYGPGVDFQALGRAEAGDVFAVTGYHTQYPWVRVFYESSPNGQAWIASDLLDIQGDIYATQAISNLSFDLVTLTPTPAVRVSSSVPGAEGVPLSPAFGVLGDSLWNGILAEGFVPEASTFGAVYLQDLRTGEALTYGADFAFSGTSINKVAVLLGYFSVIDGVPDIVQARDIANTMICSENVATNRLLEVTGNGDALYGAEQTTALLEGLGLTRTFITAPYDTTTGIATSTPMPRPPFVPTTTADQVKSEPDPTNQVTVEEMGWLLADIYQCAYQESGPLLENFGTAFTAQECRKMLYIMSENTVDGMMKAGIPAGVRVSHKHGWIATTHTNAGVFFSPGGDFVMVMALYQPTWLEFTRSLPLMAESARMVYNYFNPSVPMNAVREGYIPTAEECNYTTNDPIVQNLASSSFLLYNDSNLYYEPPVQATAEVNMTPTLRPTWTPAGAGQ